MMSRLLPVVCLVLVAALAIPGRAAPPAVADGAHAESLPSPAVAEPRRGNVRLSSVLASGGEPFPGTHFTVLRDQPGTFGEARQHIMARAGPKAVADFRLSADRYRVRVRNGAVSATQTIDVPASGDLSAQIVLGAAELRLAATLDASGTAAEQAWFRILRDATDAYGNPVREQVASDGYGDAARFVLPAGDYVAEARYGDATVQRPVTLRAGERRRLDLVLGAGRLDLVATLSADGEPVGGVDFTLLRHGDDPGSPLVEVAGADTTAAVSFVVPHGDYVARARLDRAVVEAPVTVVAGEAAALELPLQAGELVVHATLAGRDDALLDSWFEVRPDTDDDGGAPAAARGPGDRVRFVLPSGTHRVRARHGRSAGSARVDIAPGTAQTLAVALDAGRVSVSLVQADAADAQHHTWFSVYRIEHDAAGRERRERVYNDGYFASTDIVLPAGDYIAYAQAAGRRGERRFAVEPGRLQRVEIRASR
ncbi:MAG: hypothetical protein QNJ91_00100 [Gammaproteobacteria bacterium]|nr:hypothetical protein [Gammaproteobacteria bacterium]